MASSESAADDDFSAFESGVSEYESALSNAEESGAAVVEGGGEAEGGGGDSGGNAMTNGDDEDFFDAFVDANGPKLAEEGEGAVVDSAGEEAPVPLQPEVDLFGTASNEAANTAVDSMQSKSGTVDPSATNDVDPFSAFDGINGMQGDLLANESAPSQGVASPDDDDLFGMFGAAGTAETEPPTMTIDQSATAEPTGILAESVGNMMEDGDSNKGSGPSQSTSNPDPTLEAPSILTAGDSSDFDGLPSAQAESEIVDSTKGANNGGSANELDAFDAFGVQEVPLPSIDSFASIGSNGENSPPMVQDIADDSAADKPGEDIDMIDTVSSVSTGNEIHNSNGSQKEDGPSISEQKEDNTEVVTTSDEGEPDHQTNLDEGGPSNNGKQTELDETEADNSKNSSNPTLHNEVASENISLPAQTNGDDFGGFESMVEAKPDASLGTAIVADKNNLDMGTAMSLENNQQSKPASDDAFGDDFGGFTTFEGVPEQKDEADADDFGGFESIGEAKPTEVEATDDEIIDHNDNFGGFSSSEEGSTNLPIDETALATASNDASGDDFGGFTTFEGAPEQQDEGAADDFGGFESIGEAKPAAVAATDDEIIDHNDDFGGFSSFEEGPTNLPIDETAPASQISDDLNNVSVGENGDKNTGEPSNDFGIAVTEMNGGAGHMLDKAAMPSEEDDFGGFGSFEDNAELEQKKETEVKADNVGEEPDDGSDQAEDFGGFENYPSVGTKNLGEDDGPGSFDAFSEATDTIPSDPASENDKNSLVTEENTSANEPSAVPTGFNAFEDAPASQGGDAATERDPITTTAEEEASDNQAATAENGNEDLGDFEAFEDAPKLTNTESGTETEHVLNELSNAKDELIGKSSVEHQAPTTAEEQAAVSSQPSTAVISAEDDEFGDFDAFEEAPAESAPKQGSQHATASIEGDAPMSSPAAVASSADDEDEFGDFGDFDAFEEAPTESTPADDKQHAAASAEEVTQVTPPAAVASSADDEDEFGDFGDFDAFEGAPPESAPAVDEQQVDAVTEKEAPVSPPAATADDDDEFGDFGDFDAFEEAPAETAPEVDAPEEVEQKIPSPVESAPRQSVSILNENVRLMFEDVFASETPIASDQAKKGTCTKLPFDVPMSNILPDEVTPKENDTTESYQSEQELANMKNYFDSLPRSPPLTILSDEKWYPYSQYEFHRDGSPYADSVERVTTPSVPEVLSIDLPTGFEASHLSSSPTRASTPPPPPPSSSYRATPTVVDFPSSRKDTSGSNEDVVQQKAQKSEELDYSQLSATGKRFMEQLPDLSYMLKSTLSLPNDKQ